MTNPDENRLDRIEQDQAQSKVDMEALLKLIESNAKSIQALGDQAAADRDMARATRQDIADLVIVTRHLSETSQSQEREIRMQSGEIQNLADSIQNLYAQIPPTGN